MSITYGEPAWFIIEQHAQDRGRSPTKRVITNLCQLAAAMALFRGVLVE
jgi:hypothetical protein